MDAGIGTEVGAEAAGRRERGLCVATAQGLPRFGRPETHFFRHHGIPGESKAAPWTPHRSRTALNWQGLQSAGRPRGHALIHSDAEETGSSGSRAGWSGLQVQEDARPEAKQLVVRSCGIPRIQMTVTSARIEREEDGAALAKQLLPASLGSMRRRHREADLRSRLRQRTAGPLRVP